MTVILNDPGCTAIGGNTGTPGCAFNPSQIVGMILIPKEKTFTNVQLGSAFIATLQALVNVGEATRVYPVFKFEGVEDKTEDPTKKNTGYGVPRYTKRGKYNWMFEMSQGGHCHHTKLMAFNNDTSKKAIFITADNIVLMAKYGVDGAKGMSLDIIKAHDFKINNGTDPAKFVLEIGLSRAEEMNEDLLYFDAGADIEDSVKGLLDVELYDLGAGSATKKQVIGIRTACDKVSLYDAFSAIFVSSFASIFSATLAGAASNPTACVAKPLVKGWELEFPATGVHILTLASPAALAVLHIGEPPENGFEALGTLSLTVA